MAKVTGTQLPGDSVRYIHHHRRRVDETVTLSELLGVDQVTASIAAAQHRSRPGYRLAAIALESRFSGSTIGEDAFRTRTGVSILVIVRGDTTVPAP